MGYRWAIIDTETDGLWAPIHVVEIAAQLMEDGSPCGEPFQIFLDHDVVIPPETVAIHGYTREFLRKHGRPPAEAHEAFRQYLQGCPIVAHNLSFDWDRVLLPEWERLGIPAMGRRGFCTLLLARRLLYETTTHRLDALKHQFSLGDERSHRALADVRTVIRLFEQVLRPRLESLNLATFDAWQEFSRSVPVSACHRVLLQTLRQPPPDALHR
jgi:DNA polymerase III epsilon subunit-like protein